MNPQWKQNWLVASSPSSDGIHLSSGGLIWRGAATLQGQAGTPLRPPSVVTNFAEHHTKTMCSQNHGSMQIAVQHAPPPGGNKICSPGGNKIWAAALAGAVQDPKRFVHSANLVLAVVC